MRQARTLQYVYPKVSASVLKTTPSFGSKVGLQERILDLHWELANWLLSAALPFQFISC
jgi:hypothetical protein